jgi:hypothetical protein
MPTKMKVKDPLAKTLDLRKDSIEWLGFRFRQTNKAVQVRLGERAVDTLGRRFLLAHTKSQPARRAFRAIEHWVGQLGPTHKWEDRLDVLARALGAAEEHGFEEVPTEGRFRELWALAAGRWKRTRRTVLRNPGYFQPGPLTPPCPTAEVR